MAAFSVLYLALLAALAAETGVALAAHPIRVDASGGLSALDHPGGWFAPLLTAVLVLALGLIARQMLSWRRSSGERRQQMKWLASGAAVAIVSAVLAVASRLRMTPPCPVERPRTQAGPRHDPQH
jgi:putative copper export protein